MSICLFGMSNGSVVLSTLATILKDNWEWRKQIGRLAIFELVKKSRGAVLGWAWFFIKPAMYIFCFWFALESGSVQETVRRGRLRIFFGCAPASFLGSSYRTCWVQALMCCIGTPT